MPINEDDVRRKEKKNSGQQIGTVAVTRRGEEKEMEPKVVVHPRALENSAGGWMLTWRWLQAGGLLTLRGARPDSSLLIRAPQGRSLSLRHCCDGQYWSFRGTPGYERGEPLVVTMRLHLGFDLV